jgi:hypothetical protein
LFKSFAISPAEADMTHEEYQAIVPAYALGAADEPEAQLLARHLRRCRRCRALLADYRGLSEELLYTLTPVFAPVGLGGRLQRSLAYARLAQDGFEPAPASPWHRVRAILVWPIIVLALLSLLLTNVYWFDRVNRLGEQVAGQAAGQTLLAGVPTIPAAVLRSDPGSNGAQGIVYRGAGGNRALICVFDMPQLPAGMAYQVWLIEDGKRDSGGLFRVSPEGYGILMLDLQHPLADYDGVGITVEPEAGSTGPTSPRVIGGAL